MVGVVVAAMVLEFAVLTMMWCLLILIYVVVLAVVIASVARVVVAAGSDLAIVNSIVVRIA